MNHTSPDAGTSAPTPPRGRSKLAVIIPVAVFAMTLALLAWSSWPVIRPARSITVTQAVFDRASPQAPEPQPEAGARQARNGPTVQAAGWLEAEPFYIACTALADGVVASIEVLEGDHVEQGQLVARLIAEDSELRLRRAEANLATTEAQRTLTAAELLAAQSSWDEPVELDRAVEAGRASVAESRAELAQLPSLIAAGRATQRRLEEELSRAEESRSSGAATDLEVIIASENLAAQRAEVAALEAREPLLAARVRRLQADLRAAERDLSLRIEDRRRLDAAKADAQFAAASVERARAARDEAALELDRMVIRAPITGYVMSRIKVPGDKVVRMMDDPHSAHLVHLYDPERLQVRVDVPLADAANVFLGQRCEVVVEVLPDTTFAGEVLRITHEADLQKNTLQMKVKVIDPSPILRPEMLTRVRFLPGHDGGSQQQTTDGFDAPSVLIPESALSEGDAGARVWLVTHRRQNRGVLQSVAVEPVSREEGWVTVRGPVQPGAVLAVIDGTLHEGEAVIIDNADPEGAS